MDQLKCKNITYKQIYNLLNNVISHEIFYKKIDHGYLFNSEQYIKIPNWY